MRHEPSSDRFHLGFRDSLRVLLPYLRRNFLNQLSGIWFIVAYLIAFQWFVLHLPLVYAAMIGIGLLVVCAGLMFFMEGLRLGLMPLGEVFGSYLPRRSPMLVILALAFVLGVGATFAEPAIAVLKAAGAGVKANEAPLLYSLLNDFAGQLVLAVGVGVGVAVALGVLRFFFAWPLKYLAMPIAGLLLVLTWLYSRNPVLSDVLALAWDCGAVTTGPVTVPLVLALGIGVCRVVSSGSGSGGHSGFGIVTLASLFPILAVMLLGLLHFVLDDYYGGRYYTGDTVAALSTTTDQDERLLKVREDPISSEEFARYAASGELPRGYLLGFEGGDVTLEDGRMVLSGSDIVIRKLHQRPLSLVTDQHWDNEVSIAQRVWGAALDALRAIVPLCLFLYIVLRLVLRQRLAEGNDVAIGVSFALFGMMLFGLGITLGLTPLGAQLGGNVPLTFATIVPWGLDHAELAMFDSPAFGKMIAVAFGFFLGYGATLAEPALNALGDTVERITVGAFRKRLLMQSVAVGVGLGIAAGVVKLAYGLPLVWLLLPAYSVVLVLTWLSPHSFVNFGWDSAGVTTGPITVPLVLAMGLGIGGSVPGVSDGFGVLALASVGPILTVLTVGLYTHYQEQQALSRQRAAESFEEEAVIAAVEVSG
ncbi:MAG: DUF1538 domain-containing protein [Pseudomonadota bacterium]